jgi:hypothetical protein
VTRARGLVLVLLATGVARLLVTWSYVTVFWDTAVMSHLVADLRTWPPFFFWIQRGYVVYADFPKEYPVGAGILYSLIAPFMDPNDLRQITWVHGLAMGIGDLLSTAVFFGLAWVVSRGSAVVLTLAFSLNLAALVLSPLRFESWVVLFALVGYVFHRNGRPFLATLFWSVGCALKWFPAFFIAAQEWKAFSEGRKTQWIRSGLVFVGVTAAINLPFALLDYLRHGNLDFWASPYLFHMRRPLYWDTVLGVGQLWLGPLSLERYGSLWTLGLVGAALLVRPRMEVAQKGTLMILAALVLNRVYSAQFNLWFYPFLLLGLATAPEPRRKRLVILFVVLDLLNVLVYPVAFALAFDEIGAFRPWAAAERGGPAAVLFSGAILLRAVALVALALELLRGDAGASRSPPWCPGPRPRTPPRP